MKEILAAYAHKTWCNWMSYLFSVAIRNVDGSLTIPTKLVDRWVTQSRTTYEDLPEEEKESDRKEAIVIIDTIKDYMEIE